MTKMHLKTGLSDIEWFRRAADEATRDPVGMCQIVRAGRDGFGLANLATGTSPRVNRSAFFFC
jgi:hypothetical protein